MGIVMDMSSYCVEYKEAEYGEEVLCSGWNPVVAMTCRQHMSGHVWHPSAMPPSLAAIDAETFLQRMYAHQR